MKNMREKNLVRLQDAFEAAGLQDKVKVAYSNNVAIISINESYDSRQYMLLSLSLYSDGNVGVEYNKAVGDMFSYGIPKWTRPIRRDIDDTNGFLRWETVYSIDFEKALPYIINKASDGLMDIKGARQAEKRFNES